MDCANGVGAEKLKALSERLNGQLKIDLRNTGQSGLNDACGADYVQKERQFPVGMDDCQSGARLDHIPHTRLFISHVLMILPCLHQNTWLACRRAC